MFVESRIDFIYFVFYILFSKFFGQLDESTTTPDLVDQNIMYAKIMVKPARAIEYIAIDFVIASTGASFDD